VRSALDHRCTIYGQRSALHEFYVSKSVACTRPQKAGCTLLRVYDFPVRKSRLLCSWSSLSACGGARRRRESKLVTCNEEVLRTGLKRVQVSCPGMKLNSSHSNRPSLHSHNSRTKDWAVQRKSEVERHLNLTDVTVFEDAFYQNRFNSVVIAPNSRRMRPCERMVVLVIVIEMKGIVGVTPVTTNGSRKHIRLSAER
jgi:hypothetical protein